MCKIANTSFFLIHLLKKYDKLTVLQIIEKKYEVEEKIDDVFVDINYQSILISCEYYSDFFEFWGEDTIRRKNPSQVKEPTINYFNHDLDADTAAKIVNML